MKEESNFVTLYIPCRMDMFQAGTAKSAFTVLERIGLHCEYNDTQTCCGRCLYQQGAESQAVDLASKLVNEVSKLFPCVVPDCSCAAFIRNYYDKLLTNSTSKTINVRNFLTHVYELCDYIVNIRHIEALGNTFKHKVFYYQSCAARNQYPKNDAPETLLRHTHGLTLLTNNQMNGCCGANGCFAQANPEMAGRMAEDIWKQITESGAEFVTSTDIHCLQQLDAYKAEYDTNNIDVIHIADILKGED